MAEQLSQGLAIGTTILDRVLLTAVIYRFWGESGFAAWSVLVSLAGLTGLAEFGFAMYFNNAVALAVQRGEQAKAVRAFQLGFTVLSAAAICGWVLVVAFSYGYLQSGTQIVRLMTADYATVTVALLALATALRTSVTTVYALYRAHLRFTHFTLVYQGAEISRILLTVAAIAFLGLNLLGAAGIALAISGLLQCGYFLWRTRREYPRFSLAIRLPTQGERREIGGLSSAYFVQTLATILLTSLPVLLLEQQAAALGIVATFVIIRTLMGLPRMLLQTIGVVIGYECSRHLARNDSEQAMVVIGEAARSIAVASGLLIGGLFALGSEVTLFWVGDAGVFELSYAAAAGVPLVFTAASVISHNVLVSANTPYLGAIGRFLQLILTLVLAFALPIDDPALRMFIALGAGEMFGYAPLSYIAVYRSIPQAGLAFHSKMILLSVAACAACWAGIALFGKSVADASEYGWIIEAAFAAVFCSVAFLIFGLSTSQRRALLELMLRRDQGA